MVFHSGFLAFFRSVRLTFVELGWVLIISLGTCAAQSAERGSHQHHCYRQQQLLLHQQPPVASRRIMSRKDDPVFNVKFVQLVESHPCLWNSTLPEYSKKDEVQKAWQEVANETKDTLRSCRERWRTIRSSFLRSLKMARTSTGRGKRKYYLSKYLQFLIPYTKSRHKQGGLTTLRKCPQQPMTRISNMPLPLANNEDTKDSTTSEVAIAEDDVVVSLHEEAQLQRFPAIKTEAGVANSQERIRSQFNTTATPLSSIHNLNSHNNSHNNNNNNNNNTNGPLGEIPPPRSASAVDLTEFAEWIKSKNDHQRHCLMSQPDADQSFLNSLHPFLREMSGKQNRRFRQKVIGLIDAILENAD